MNLRVGLVTSEFPPDHGGVETYAWHLAQELGTRPDLSVTVYAPHRAAAIQPPPGVNIKPILTNCIGLDWPRLVCEPIDVWHALSAAHGWIAEKGRPTVVSVHGNDFLAPYPLTARPALYVPGLYKIRPVIWRRLRGLWRRNTLRMLSRSLPQASAILSNSRYTADVLTARYPGCASKVEVAWVGVGSCFFDIEHTARGAATRLLTVCRLSEPRKNIHKVLHALAALKEKFTFEYRVAGDGSNRQDLQQLACRVGLHDRVHFLGRVNDSDLRDLYAQADLFVLPASVTPDSHEGFGIVYLEAAASGTPSLAARLAGATEAVREGSSGFFVKSTEISDIRDALEQFLSRAVSFDPATCREFAKGFGWDRVAKHCHAAYTRALSGR